MGEFGEGRLFARIEGRNIEESLFGSGGVELFSGLRSTLTSRKLDERERERSYGKMVQAELGGRISRALQQMSNATFIDEKVLAECLKEISRALLQADVQFKMAMNMQNNIKKIVNLDDLAAGHNKRKIIQQVREFPPPSLPPHPSVPPPLF